jgi:hypothetical protein
VWKGQLKPMDKWSIPRVGALLVGLFLLLPRTVPAGDLSYNLNFWNEAGIEQVNGRSPFNPDNDWLERPIWSNSMIVAGGISCRFGSRLKVAGSFFDRYDHVLGDSNRLRLKELYVSVSLDDHWDVTAGKRILRWGTGYAWTPTGVLDPPHDPRDPTDRLDQDQGRELLEICGTYGNHNLTAVFAAPHLFSRFQASRPDAQFALKYNTLVHGLDYSIIVSVGGPRSSRSVGANATYVIGQSLEIHGECLLDHGPRRLYPLAIALENPQVTFPSPPYAPLKERDPRFYCKALAGANYTLPSGLNFVVEWYHDSEGLTAWEQRRFEEFVTYNEAQLRLTAPEEPGRITLPACNLLWTLQGIAGFSRAQDYFFARVVRSGMARKWDLENIVICSLRDGSSVWIPQVTYDVSPHVSGYVRCTACPGGRRTEFGSLPTRSFWVFGIALRF